MPTVLVIGYIWPEPNSSAAGKRMLQLLDFFKSVEYKVIFSTTAAPSYNAPNLEELGIESKKIELNNPNFDNYIKTLLPEIVLFDRFMMEEQFGWRVTKNSPDSIKILDTEDLHFLRGYREKTTSQSILTSELAKREIASIYRCDLSLIISENEMTLLLDTFSIPDNLILYIPFLLNTIKEEQIALLPSFEEREHFISIGNFKHKPNVDAVKYLKSEIWPIIRRELPNAEMNIYGAYPIAAVEQLHNSKENFHIRGWAKNAEEVVKYSRVSLAALRFGAGLKGKLIEAMQCGTPTITTTIGAEGMSGDLPWNGFIKDDPNNFAVAAIKLYKTKSTWLKSQNFGFNILNNRYNKNTFHAILKEKLIFLKTNLYDHRKDNFIGSMLMHHRVKSTQHLSKYIEVKNKLETFKNSSEN